MLHPSYGNLGQHKKKRYQNVVGNARVQGRPPSAARSRIRSTARPLTARHVSERGARRGVSVAVLLAVARSWCGVPVLCHIDVAQAQTHRDNET